MAYVITFPLHYLDIGGVPLSTPAWEVLNLETLMEGPDVRGEPRLIPGAVGVRANPLRPTATTHTLELYFHGYADWEDTPYTDPHAGVLANVAWFRANVSDPSAGAVTRTATLYVPDPDEPTTAGTSLTGAVQLRKLSVGSFISTACVPATLDMVVLAGALT
jgi:hypothetical protein